MANGRTIFGSKLKPEDWNKMITSDADRRRMKKKILGESGRSISDADRRRIERALLEESGRSISDADRALMMEKYINRNDGGIAKKTRTF